MRPFHFGFEFEFEEEREEAEGEGQEQERVYTVAELNRAARELLEQGLGYVWLTGEVSGLRNRSGHLYFTLKDAEAEIDAVIFAGDALFLETEPEDGQQVLAYGRVTLYERRGRYQFVVQELRPAGRGQLQMEFERLKERLQAEGLFAPEHKRPLPRFPSRIGVVTSPDGAAIRDICTTIAKRFPAVELILFPVRVQGVEAAPEIAHAIALANHYSAEKEKLDLLIVGRGGGSLEDLWAFNTEEVARVIFASEIPIISAVGHEIDFTIADFVADARAATPTAAAQLAVPDKEELLARVAELRRAMEAAVERRLAGLEEQLERLRRSYAFRLPLQRIEDALQNLASLQERLERAVHAKLDRMGLHLEGLLQRLEAANPAAILRRGYAWVTHNGKPVRAANEVAVGARVRVKLAQGALGCRVEEVELSDG